jgi:hypothetical protein
MTYIVISSIESYSILFSTHKGKQNHHTTDLVESTGNLFRKVAYTKYDVPSEMFQTQYMNKAVVELIA